jgi:iron complex transport system substrate-binding protein
MRVLALVVMAGLLFAGFPGAVAAAKPARIVSLNLCADQLVLLLAEPARIASVSYLARDPALSNLAAAAAGVAVNHGRLEEVLASRPDLVVAGAHTTRRAAALLKHFGVNVVEIGIPRNLDEVRGQLRRLGRVLGETAKAERLLAGMDAKIARAARARAGANPLAVVYNPNGLVLGAGTLANDILRAAGFDDLAERLDFHGFEPLALESLVLHAPDLLVRNEDWPDRPSRAAAVLRHPALRAAFADARTLAMPSRLWLCEGPFNADAVERLAAARRQLINGREGGGEP